MRGFEINCRFKIGVWENMVELKTEYVSVSVYSSIMEFVTMFTHVSRWDPAILNLFIYCRYQLG